jgi:hypothetical protein
MLKRFPSFTDILPLYALIAVMSYSWTVSKFLWKLPSWLLYLTPGEALSIFAYVMVSALLESMLILGVLLLASLILPGRIFKDAFVVRGTWFVMIFYGSLMIYLTLYADYQHALDAYWMIWLAGSTLLGFLAAFLSMRLRFARSFALWISDRFIVFLFILIPVSMVSILVVLIRNLT